MLGVNRPLICPHLGDGTALCSKTLGCVLPHFEPEQLRCVFVTLSLLLTQTSARALSSTVGMKS